MLVEIDEKWVRLINSPMGYIAGVLSGLSLTFAPIGLYFAGRSSESVGGPMVFLCMAVILYCGFFHYKLAQAVMAQVHWDKKTASQPD